MWWLGEGDGTGKNCVPVLYLTMSTCYVSPGIPARSIGHRPKAALYRKIRTRKASHPPVRHTRDEVDLLIYVGKLSESDRFTFLVFVVRMFAVWSPRRK